MEGLEDLPRPNPNGYSGYTPEELAQIRTIPAEKSEVWGRFATACLSSPDKDAFFPDGSEDLRKVAQLCVRYECPVVQQCGVDALRNRDDSGVRGGMTPRERRRIRKEYPGVF